MNISEIKDRMIAYMNEIEDHKFNQLAVDVEDAFNALEELIAIRDLDNVTAKETVNKLVAKHDQELAEGGRMVEQMRSRNSQLSTRNRELAEAVLEYGGHKKNCVLRRSGGDCSCGFEAVQGLINGEDE